MASFINTYSGGVDEKVQMEDISIEGSLPYIPRRVSYENTSYNPADSLPGISNATDLMNIAAKTKQAPSDTAEAITKMSEQSQKNFDESRQMEKNAAIMRGTAGLLRAIGGVVNANTKFSQIQSQNAYNIRQAEMQALMIASDAKSKMLKEETKGKSRGNAALINAVAQGQSASGDLAKTAISNEDVYSAQNIMNMEINLMRQVFGLESQQRLLASDTRMAEINRDLSINQAIVGGVADIGVSAFSVMK